MGFLFESASPGTGTFTVASDVERVAPVMACLVENKLQRYLDEGKLHLHRMLLSLRSQLFAGLPLNVLKRLKASHSIHSRDLQHVEALYSVATEREEMLDACAEFLHSYRF